MFDELQNKPKAIKQNYAFWGAAATTGVIAAVWLVTLSARFEEGDFFSEEGEAQTAGAFSHFFGRIKEDVSNIWQHPGVPAESEEITTSETNVATTSTTTKPIGPSVQIATSSQKSQLTATSSGVAE